MMGLIQGAPTKRDAALAAEATRESWQALLDRLALLVQARSLPERQSVRNDVLGAVHVHMARRSYENRVNWQIERDEFLAALNDPAADPAAIVARLRSIITKPAAPSEPIPPLSAKPAQEPERPPKLSEPKAAAPKVIVAVPGQSTSIQVESRAPEYAIQRVKGTWVGVQEEAYKLIEADLREHYPFGGREIRVGHDGTFSYIGHTD